MVEEILIPLFAMAVPVLIVGIVFAYKYQQRKFIHQERLAMIEKGIAPQGLAEIEEVRLQTTPTRSLYNGVITACIGLAILLGLGTIGYGPWLLGGLIPLAVGIGAIIAYVASNGNKDNNEPQ